MLVSRCFRRTAPLHKTGVRCFSAQDRLGKIAHLFQHAEEYNLVGEDFRGTVIEEGQDIRTNGQATVIDGIFGGYTFAQTSGNYGALPKPMHWTNFAHQGLTFRTILAVLGAFFAAGAVLPGMPIIAMPYMFTNERKAKRQANEKYHSTRYGNDAKRIFYSD